MHVALRERHPDPGLANARSIMCSRSLFTRRVSLSMVISTQYISAKLIELSAYASR